MKPEMNLKVNLINPDGTPFIPPFEDGTAYVRVHPQDMEDIRIFVQQEVQNALHPTLGTVDIMHFLTVEATDETGKRWTGVLYAREEEET